MTPQVGSSFAISGRLRNTLRAVVPIRLSDAERGQISAAAEFARGQLDAFDARQGQDAAEK
jgi:hypothetical protein